MGCPPVTSPRRWRRSSARRRGCQPRPSVGCLAPGRPTTKHFASVTWPSGTMWTSGRMGSTSGPFGAGPPVLSGAGGRARRRHQGTGRGRRRRARVDRVVGGAAGGSAPPRDAGAGGRGRRRRAGPVGRPARCLPSHPPAARLGPQARQCAQRLAQQRPRRCAEGVGEIRDAPDRDHAERAIELFARDYGVKWPKAVAKITNDAEALLTFYDFPAEHWVHLRTSNPMSRPSRRYGCALG
jgi:hypothetical protein